MSDNTHLVAFEGQSSYQDTDAVVLRFAEDTESLALQAKTRIKVIASNGTSSSTLFVIEPDGSLTLATNISKKLGLNLTAGGQLKVNFDREF